MPLQVALGLLLIVSLKRLFVALRHFHGLYFLLSLLIILLVLLLLWSFMLQLISVIVIFEPLPNCFPLASSHYLQAAFAVEKFSSY